MTVRCHECWNLDRFCSCFRPTGRPRRLGQPPEGYVRRHLAGWVEMVVAVGAVSGGVCLTCLGRVEVEHFEPERCLVICHACSLYGFAVGSDP